LERGEGGAHNVRAGSSTAVRGYTNSDSSALGLSRYKGGVGHNLPQEAPQAFAKAIVEVDGY